MDERQIGRALRAHRLSAELDQRDLAERAGIGVTALRRLEQGKGSTVQTLLAVTRALDLDLMFPAPSRHELKRAPRRTVRRPRLERREERVGLELHRAVVRRLRRDPEGVRSMARANLEHLRDRVRGTIGREWVDTWERALKGPTDELIELCLRQDETGIDLRQVSPFVGVLTEEERLTAIHKAQAW